MTAAPSEGTSVWFTPLTTVTCRDVVPPVAVFDSGWYCVTRFCVDIEPWSFNETDTSTSLFTAAASVGTDVWFTPLSTVTVRDVVPPVAVFDSGLYCVTRLTVVLLPWSFGVSSISTTLLTPGAAVGVVVVFSFRSVVVVTTPFPEFEDPPPVFSVQVCVTVVLSAVFPSSFFLIVTVFRLLTSAVCSTVPSCAGGSTTSTFVSVCTLVSFSQLSAIVIGVAAGVNFSTVRFRRSVSVFSTVRVSPISCAAAVLVATSAVVKLRSVVAADVPRSSFRTTVLACSTFLSLTFRFVMSVVQSGFFDKCRSTRSPLPTLAASPVVATSSCCTPRCCSSLTSSNSVLTLS